MMMQEQIEKALADAARRSAAKSSTLKKFGQKQRHGNEGWTQDKYLMAVANRNAPAEEGQNLPKMFGQKQRHGNEGWTQDKYLMTVSKTDTPIEKAQKLQLERHLLSLMPPPSPRLAQRAVPHDKKDAPDTTKTSPKRSDSPQMKVTENQRSGNEGMMKDDDFMAALKDAAAEMEKEGKLPLPTNTPEKRNERQTTPKRLRSSCFQQQISFLGEDSTSVDTVVIHLPPATTMSEDKTPRTPKTTPPRQRNLSPKPMKRFGAKAHSGDSFKQIQSVNTAVEKQQQNAWSVRMLPQMFGSAGSSPSRTPASSRHGAPSCQLEASTIQKSSPARPGDFRLSAFV